MKTDTPHSQPPARSRWPLQPWQRELILDVWQYIAQHQLRGEADRLLAELLNHLPEIQFDTADSITFIHDHNWWPFICDRKLPERPISYVLWELKRLEIFSSDLFSLIHRAEQAALNSSDCPSAEDVQ